MTEEESISALRDNSPIIGGTNFWDFVNFSDFRFFIF